MIFGTLLLNIVILYVNVSLVCSLFRKEADLQKREVCRLFTGDSSFFPSIFVGKKHCFSLQVALKIAADTYGGGNEELAILRMEIEVFGLTG